MVEGRPLIRLRPGRALARVRLKVARCGGIAKGAQFRDVGGRENTRNLCPCVNRHAN
jgi:hypothetical protein